MRRHTIRLRLVQIGRNWIFRRCGAGYLVRYDRRGRALVYLGRKHRFADRSGQQYVARFKVAMALGELPPTDRHAHHVDLRRQHDAIANLALLPADEHGRLHAAAMTAAGQRGVDGRFRRVPVAVAA